MRLTVLLSEVSNNKYTEEGSWVMIQFWFSFDVIIYNWDVA